MAITDTELMLDVGQANELKLAFRRAGWTNPDIKRMSEGDLLTQILPFVRGHAEITLVEHIIDCSTVPFCPDNWEVLPPEEQIPTRFQGPLNWDKEAQKKAFYLSGEQITGQKWVEGNKLRKELTDKLVVALPANVLDYLLKNPILIPEEWKSNAVFFWGTIYRNSDGSLCGRCLCWSGSGWGWRCFWLDRSFFSSNPAALPASQN